MTTPMPSAVSEHYAKHLAPIYSWMVGDFDIACEVNSKFFDELDLHPALAGRAVDLGSGHGLQTVPLARRGFDVIAIDSSEILLAELSEHSDGLRITPIHDDLLNVADHVNGSVNVITCMGDTLTHLPSLDAVQHLIETSVGLLDSNGILIFSFRDYSSSELEGVERFIPVRSDDKRIHTCFLEYTSKFVHVHDIVHTRCESSWLMKVSSYPKLRLSSKDLVAYAMEKGLTIFHQSVRSGMLHLAFKVVSQNSTMS